MLNGQRRAKYVASLNEKMSVAVAGVRCAEEELDAAVRDLSPRVVGDKVVSTVGLDDSFAKLREARKHVVDLRELLLKV
jgi:hypothetical protein